MASEAAGTRSMLEAWRESGADRLNPVRFRLIDALTRRAACQSGEVRRVLDERIARLVEVYAEDVDAASRRASGDGNGTSTPPPPHTRSVLAELVDQIASHVLERRNPRGDRAIGPTASACCSDPEPEALDYFRQTWSKLSTARQLRLSCEQVPGNAGPLNSESLVYRSLSLMRELSPDYLRQFLSYVDALSWMERLNESGGTATKDAPRNASLKRNVRGKSR